MKKTIVKIIKLKAGYLRRQTKLTNILPDLSRRKERRIKPTKLEMKRERLQQKMQKHNGL